MEHMEQSKVFAMSALERCWGNYSDAIAMLTARIQHTKHTEDYKSAVKYIKKLALDQNL